jgi:hypothetical protein
MRVNVFNRVQFAPPGTAYNLNTWNTSGNTFGVLTSQNNQPRQAQFVLRLRFLKENIIISIFNPGKP